VEDKSLSSGSDGSSYWERASWEETDDDEEEEEELARKRKHYLKQRYSLQKVSVDGSNSMLCLTVIPETGRKQSRMIPQELTRLKM